MVITESGMTAEVRLAVLLNPYSSKDAVYIPLDEEIQVSIPENFPEIQYDLSANSPTKRGFELGKKLFCNTCFSLIRFNIIKLIRKTIFTSINSSRI